MSCCTHCCEIRQHINKAWAGTHAYLASANEKNEVFMASPMPVLASTISFRSCRYRIVRASAFFFSSACPLVAPTRRAFMTVSTVTVGGTVYLLVLPDMMPNSHNRCANSGLSLPREGYSPDADALAVALANFSDHSKEDNFHDAGHEQSTSARNIVQPVARAPSDLSCATLNFRVSSLTAGNNNNEIDETAYFLPTVKRFDQPVRNPVTWDSICRTNRAFTIYGGSQFQTFLAHAIVL